MTDNWGKRDDKMYFKTFKEVLSLGADCLETSGWAFLPKEAPEQLSGLIWVRDERVTRGLKALQSAANPPSYLICPAVPAFSKGSVILQLTL